MNPLKETRRNVFIGLMLFVSFIFLTGICHSGEPEGFKPGFSLKLTGGARYIAIGDMNEHLKSYIDLPDSFGNLEEIGNWSGDLELELRMDISPRVALGLATSGFLRKRSERSLFVYGGDLNPEVVKFDTQSVIAPGIEASMPLGLNVYFSIPLGSKLGMYLSPGVGWYSGKMTKNETTYMFYSDGTVDFGNVYWAVENKFSVGFQGALGLEYRVAGNLILVTELQGRYIRMNGLKGREEFVYKGGHFEGSGTLYYWRSTYGGEVGPWITALEVRERLPGGGTFSVKDAREAILDLSGFSLRVGLRVRLF
jgi:opacity protein-like surface antigen